MNKSLLEILACPYCKVELKLTELEAQDPIVFTGLLHCNGCSRKFPIIDEIPILLPDEMRDADKDARFMETWKDKITAATPAQP